MQRFVVMLVLFLFASLATAQTPVATPTGADADQAALDFLGKLEKKNTETTSLQAKFRQVRVDRLMMTTVESDGRFWYKAPAQFHAHYKGDGEETGESDIWMSDGKLVSYDAVFKQVEIIKQETGDDAAISQLLLGFGVKVDKIRKHFDIAGLPAEEGEIAIEFKSRNLEQSMGYDSIVVYFDKETVEPKTIVLADDQSEITVTLQDVKVNPKIDDKVFEPKWPKDTEVLNYE